MPEGSKLSKKKISHDKLWLPEPSIQNFPKTYFFGQQPTNKKWVETCFLLEPKIFSSMMSADAHVVVRLLGCYLTTGSLKLTSLAGAGKGRKCRKP